MAYDHDHDVCDEDCAIISQVVDMCVIPLSTDGMNKGGYTSAQEAVNFAGVCSDDDDPYAVALKALPLRMDGYNTKFLDAVAAADPDSKGFARFITRWRGQRLIKLPRKKSRQV